MERFYKKTLLRADRQRNDNSRKSRTIACLKQQDYQGDSLQYGMLFIAYCEINGGICFIEDIRSDLDKDSTNLTSAIDGLIKNGYLRKMSWNTYALEEY